jgi:hypothetical protein
MIALSNRAEEGKFAPRSKGGEKLCRTSHMDWEEGAVARSVMCTD